MPTKTSSPRTQAEIAAETNAAQATDFNSALLIDLIDPHPRNIRHNAAADEEMVESIRAKGLYQPLVVRPIEDGRYQLVAGHRRLDGLKRAGFTHAPAAIRLDLGEEVDQVAAMLVENGRRADLTPIEEAEGFDLLAELGWTVDQIAAASGQSKATVSSRRKLVRLPEQAKAAVGQGQVTLDDALRLAKLPTPEQTKLEKLLGRSDFHYEITRTEQRVKVKAEVAAQAKQLLADGIPEVPAPTPAVINEYYLRHSEHGMVRLASTGHPDLADHPDCGAFVRGGTAANPAIWRVCTNPGAHDELTEAQLERKAALDAEEAAREARVAEARERQQARVTARQLRVDDVMAAVRTKPLDPVLADLLALALPRLAAELPYDVETTWQRAMGVKDDDMVRDFGIDHAVAVIGSDTARLTKALAALLVCTLEDEAEVARFPHGAGFRPAALEYLNKVLPTVGHQRNTIDTELVEELEQDTDQ